MKTGDTYHLADPVQETRPTCGAILTKWVSPSPTQDRDEQLPGRQSISAGTPMAAAAGGGVTYGKAPAWAPRHIPPRMTDENDLTDGVFIFHDTFIEGASMEVVPQLSGNVEITIGYGPDDGYMLTLSHLDRADLLRALLHDFHYSPERGGPHDTQD